MNPAAPVRRIVIPAGSAEASREQSLESIRAVIGPEKSEQLLALAREHWNKGSEELEAAAAAKTES
jgi:hypothetical protein